MSAEAPRALETDGSPPATTTAGTVARNASVLAVATLVARLSGFGFGIVMARALGAEIYGKYGFAFALGTVLVPLADLGLTPYLSREAARARLEADAAAKRLLGVKLALSAGVLAATSAVVLLVVGDELLLGAILVVLLGMLADGVSTFVYGYFQGRESMGFEAATTATVAIVRSVGGAALVLLTGALMPALAWLLIVSVAQMAYAGMRFRTALTVTAHARPAAATVKVEWLTVGAMGLITIFVMVYLRADAVMIGLLKSDREVGFYTAAYTLLLGLQVVPWMIAIALTPVFARSHGREQGLFNASWREGIKAVLLVSLPLALTTSILAGPIINRFFGDGYDPAAAVLAVLVWSSPLAALNVVVGGVLRGVGRERWLTVGSGMGAALNVGLNLWAIRQFGIEGAAAVTVATEAAIVLGLGSLCQRHGIIPAPRLPLGRMALALAGLASVAATVPLPLEPVAALALLAYLAILLVSGAVSRRDLTTVRSMIARRG